MATGRLGNIALYADDPPALGAFWAQVFGYPQAGFEGELKERLPANDLTDLAKRGLAEDPEGGGPRLFFHHAAAPKPEGARNRLHLDIQATLGRHPTPPPLSTCH